MAKKKRKKGKARKTSFKFGKSKKKAKLEFKMPNLMPALKVLAVVCVLAAIAVGFFFLERYVRNRQDASSTAATVVLMDVPTWVNEQLKDKILTAAHANGEDLKPDEDAAMSVQQNLETLVPWLDEIKVQATHDRLLVRALWRKPVAMVKLGLLKRYVDSEMVVLDFLPMPDLPIIEVKGFSAATAPPPGDTWDRPDVAAAAALLTKLDLMDKEVTPDKPLLAEIDRIDVSNFAGHRNTSAAHIVLYAKDNTKIIWGAELGMWQRYLESTDEQKLNKLYSYYEENNNTLLNNANFVNLRDPQHKIPRPIDRY